MSIVHPKLYQDSTINIYRRRGTIDIEHIALRWYWATLAYLQTLQQVMALTYLEWRVSSFRLKNTTLAAAIFFPSRRMFFVVFPFLSSPLTNFIIVAKKDDSNGAVVMLSVETII